MSGDEFIARPGQQLSDHHDGVAANAVKIIPASLKTKNGNSFPQLISTVAHLHDLGKLTTYFQEYVNEDGRRQPNELEKHSRVGAALTFHALGEQGFTPEECLAGFYAVQKHHGTLPNIPKAHSNWKMNESWFEYLGSQLRNIKTHARKQADERLSIASDQTLHWTDIPVSEALVYRNLIGDIEVTETFYPLLLRTWSTLTCADKVDAAGEIDLGKAVHRPDPDAISFDSDAEGIQQELNRYRTNARKNVRNRLTNDETDNDVYRLTLPTGFGKTAAGLEAALSLASKRDGRVIYALPYTTVIDQVDGVIQDQFEVSPLGEKYTIHHHLADTRTKPGESSETVSDGTEVLYGETWQVGLVLTTFVQLFESVAGPGNLQSIKLPALQDAVIIVDEPQALPNRWWHLLSRLSTMLTEEYNATLVFMTATQPKFIEEYNPELDPTELVPNVEEHFEFLASNQRVTFTVHESLAAELQQSDDAPLSAELAGETVVDEIGDEAVNVLVINNTVGSAVAVGREIKNQSGNRAVLDLNERWRAFVSTHPDIVVRVGREEKSPSSVAKSFLNWLAEDAQNKEMAVVTLTAALRPGDRRSLIEAMRTVVDSDESTVLDELSFVVSATQLIEAGVDVSADRVYRDFAPLPSIVQAAGRCNRSFDGEMGEVTMWLMDSEEQKPSQIYTYGRDRLKPAKAALRKTVGKNATAISEATMVSSAVDQYYAELYSADETTDEYDGLASAVDNAEGDTLREASLVEDHNDDVLVIATDEELAALETYLSRRNSDQYHDAKEAFGTLKHLLASASEDRIEQLEATESLLAHLGYEGTTLREFDIVDARTQPLYDFHGLGIQE